MEFKIFGPFPIELDGDGSIPNSVRDFWDLVEKNAAGLSEAKGCYVFGIQSSGGPRITPWYIGKTNNQTFATECFKAHQRNHYWRALSRRKRKRPYLFFLAALTKGGRRFSKNRNARKIDFLETYLIGLGLRANANLLNKRDTKLYREIVVPGLLNSGHGSPGGPANNLRKSLKF
jgi:hypothetical protein